MRDEQVLKVIEQIKQETDFIQKAQLIDFLAHTEDIPVKTIGELLSLKPSYVCHILRLKRLPDIIVDGYYSKLITISHLFIVSRLKETAQMVLAYEKILSQNLSVLQTEMLVREILHGIKSVGEKLPREKIDQFITSIEKNGQKVSVNVLQSRIKAKLVVEVRGSVRQTTSVLQDLIDRLQANEGR